MKHMFGWFKLFTLNVSVLGVVIVFDFWRFMSGGGTLFTSLGASLGNMIYHPINWAVTIILVIFGLLAFAFVTHNKSWKHFPFGLPLFIFNYLTLAVWWHVELGKFGDLYLSGI